MYCSLLISKCILILSFPRSILAQKTTHELEDFTGRIDKLIMQRMATELVIDAKLYHRQMTVIREQHNFFLSYEVGLIMGQIRETYKRMMEVYHEAITKKNRAFDILPPYVDDYKSLHFLVHMETIRSLEMEIDKLIHVLETIPMKMITDRNALPDMSKMLENAMAGGTLPGMEGMAGVPGGPDGAGAPGAPGGMQIPAGLLPPGFKFPADHGPPKSGPPQDDDGPPIPPGGGRMRSEDQDSKSNGSTSHPLTAEEVKKAYRDEYYSKRREDNWTLDDYYVFSG